MKTMKYLVFALIGLVGFAFSQQELASTNVNGFSVLKSKTQESTDSTSTVYSAKFTGSGINGRKVIIGFAVTDTASAGTSTTAPTVDVDLQGSFDGTNFFNVSAAVVNDDRFYGSTYATPGAGTCDLTAWNLPWYRLALVPSANIGNTHSQYTDGKFNFYVAGLP